MHPYDIAQLKRLSPTLAAALRIHGLALLRFLTQEVHDLRDYWNGQQSCYHAYFKDVFRADQTCEKCGKMAYCELQSPYTAQGVRWCVDCIVEAFVSDAPRYVDPEMVKESPWNIYCPAPWELPDWDESTATPGLEWS